MPSHFSGSSIKSKCFRIKCQRSERLPSLPVLMVNMVKEKCDGCVYMYRLSNATLASGLTFRSVDGVQVFRERVLGLSLVVVVPPILLQSLYTEIADLNQVPAHSASSESSENCGLPLNK